MEDIFSKGRPRKKKPQKIIIDHREKNSLVVSELNKLGFDIEFHQLPVADYLINGKAIERKTIPDLQSSIINKRIIGQLQGLKQYQYHALLIEGIGRHDPYQGPIHENSFRGFLLSAAIEYNTPMIFTYDEQDTAKYLSVLARKKAKPEASIRASRVLLSDKGQQQFILEGFPNIGPKSAQKLLKKFRSIKKIVTASKKELSEVLGKKADAFSKLIHRRY